jgi:hypothetical protein
VRVRLQAEKPIDHELPEAVRSPFTPAGLIYRVASAAWQAGVTPGAVVRTLGPFARRFTRGYADRRMHVRMGLPRADCDLLEAYMFETLAQKGSGEVRKPCRGHRPGWMVSNHSGGALGFVRA